MLFSETEVLVRSPMSRRIASASWFMVSEACRLPARRSWMAMLLRKRATRSCLPMARAMARPSS